MKKPKYMIGNKVRIGWEGSYRVMTIRGIKQSHSWSTGKKEWAYDISEPDSIFGNWMLERILIEHAREHGNE